MWIANTIKHGLAELVWKSFSQKFLDAWWLEADAVRGRHGGSDSGRILVYTRASPLVNEELCRIRANG